MLLRISITLLLLAVAAVPRVPADPRYAMEDSSGSSCVAAAVSERSSFQVVAYYDYIPGAYVGGSYEFRLAGIPPEWSATAIPNPEAVVVLGDPLGGGTNVGFANCSPGEDSRVVLFTIEVQPTSAEVISLTLEAHTLPSNLNFDCPHMWFCAPVFGAICFPPEALGTIRSDGGSCVVSVRDEAWTDVKHLYR